MRTAAQIKREIAEAEASAADPTLKGSKLFSPDQQRKLYAARAEALRAELAAAEGRRQAMLTVAQGAKPQLNS